MLASEVIQSAYREGNLKGINDVLTNAEQAEGLYRLNALWRSFTSSDIGELLSDWNIPMAQKTAEQNTDFINLPYPNNLTSFDQPGVQDNYSQNISNWPPQNCRIVSRITADTTLYLPQFPDDGAQMAWVDNMGSGVMTIDANGRMIEGGASVTLNPGDPTRKWFFRADLANWVRQADIALTDSMPLPDEFDDLFVTGLAIRLCALDMQEPQPSTLSAYKDILQQAQARYRQRGQMSYMGQNIPNSMQSYDAAYYGNRRW